jgi:hypothetical protein
LDVLNILKTLRKVKFMQKMFFTKQIRQLMMRFEENVITSRDRPKFDAKLQPWT